jgi:hypothetical protein
LVVSLEAVKTITANKAMTTAQINSGFILVQLERERAISFNDGLKENGSIVRVRDRYWEHPPP